VYNSITRQAITVQCYTSNCQP